jgi:hypothetical protein
MSLVDGAARFAVPLISTRGPKRDRRLYDTVNTQMIGPVLAHYASGARYSFGERLLVVTGEDLCTGSRANSTLPVPTDGAGGVRLR